MFSTHLRGAEQAQARLRIVQTMLNDVATMRADLATSAQPMAALARELSPHAYEYPRFSAYRGDSDTDWMDADRSQGNLRRNINVIQRMGAQASVTVTARTPYARAQEYGAFITPKRGRYLHFIGKGGDDVFTRAVTLPPRPYMRPAYEALWPELPVHLAIRLALRFAAAFGGRVRSA